MCCDHVSCAPPRQRGAARARRGRAGSGRWGVCLEEGHVLLAAGVPHAQEVLDLRPGEWRPRGLAGRCGRGGGGVAKGSGVRDLDPMLL
jgi:hypothetical protein